MRDQPDHILLCRWDEDERNMQQADEPPMSLMYRRSDNFFVRHATLVLPNSLLSFSISGILNRIFPPVCYDQIRKGLSAQSHAIIMKRLILLVAVLARVLTVFAQTSVTQAIEPAKTATKSTAVATHTVRVGLQHDFEPDTIKANPGDTIRFNFYPTNHSVVRAAYKRPCIPWELTQDPTETFFSGPVEQDTLQSPIPSWDLKVNNTDPVFFYCSAPDSCIKWGMVGVINPNKTWTLDVQKAYVENTTFQLSPGEAFPDEASSTTPSGSAPTSTDIPAAEGDSGSKSLSGGAIAGIAIGCVAGVAVIIALVYLIGRKGGIKKGYQRSRVSEAAPPQIVEANYNDNVYKSPSINSPYPVSYSDPYRSPSPTAWGSPHTSYMGHTSPGFSPYNPNTAFSPEERQQAYLEAPDARVHAIRPPAELPGSPGNQTQH
ncbi:hypothetical protein M426DRAFT_9008 [Hypoxylon sp. CI-4A]|nr:hypothetical protein M426DRAFT_9008 [Hypoxylon sp. CI-4A]